jgi:hypothetical protein
MYMHFDLSIEARFAGFAWDDSSTHGSFVDGLLEPLQRCMAGCIPGGPTLEFFDSCNPKDGVPSQIDVHGAVPLLSWNCCMP